MEKVVVTIVQVLFLLKIVYFENFIQDIRIYTDLQKLINCAN